MLVKGPAPDSGVSDVSLKVPEAPQGEYDTRDLPLVVPEQAPEGGVVGLQAADADGDALPTVDTTTAPSGRDAPKAGDSDAQATMLPPTAAGGDYAVQFAARSEEHTSELQSLMRISYAVFCLQKNTK